MDPRVRKYLSMIGRNGGKKSRRVLPANVAREMVRVREARRAFRRFHAQCFWSYDPGYRIGPGDTAWVAEKLMRHGGRAAWELGARLCR